jgi:hypothetical protein
VRIGRWAYRAPRTCSVDPKLAIHPVRALSFAELEALRKPRCCLTYLARNVRHLACAFLEGFLVTAPIRKDGKMKLEYDNVLCQDLVDSRGGYC